MHFMVVMCSCTKLTSATTRLVLGLRSPWNWTRKKASLKHAKSLEQMDRPPREKPKAKAREKEKKVARARARRMGTRKMVERIPRKRVTRLMVISRPKRQQPLLTLTRV